MFFRVFFKQIDVLFGSSFVIWNLKIREIPDAFFLFCLLFFYSTMHYCVFSLNQLHFLTLTLELACFCQTLTAWCGSGSKSESREGLEMRDCFASRVVWGENKGRRIFICIPSMPSGPFRRDVRCHRRAWHVNVLIQVGVTLCKGNLWERECHRSPFPCLHYTAAV